jgi:hypothetical protein
LPEMSRVEKWHPSVTCVVIIITLLPVSNIAPTLPWYTKNGRRVREGEKDEICNRR